MKKLFLLLFISFISISGLRSQIGNYCAFGDLSRTCYEFKEGNRFTCTDFMCTGIEEGQGKFEIEGDKIRFSYEAIPFFEEQFTIKKIKETQDKIELQFVIKDYDTGKSITEYSVHQSKRGRLENKIIHSKNKINLPYEGEPIYLDVSFPEYSNCTFEIKENGQYKVDIFLRYGRERDVYETMKKMEEFTIMKMVEDSITLRVEKYNYELVFIKEE